MKFSLFEQNHMPKEYFMLVIKDEFNLLKTAFFLRVQYGEKIRKGSQRHSALELPNYAGYCSRES